MKGTILSTPKISTSRAMPYWNALKVRYLKYQIDKKFADKKLTWPALIYSNRSVNSENIGAILSEEAESIENFYVKNPDRLIRALPEIERLVEVELISNHKLTDSHNELILSGMKLIEELWPDAYEETTSICIAATWFKNSKKNTFSSPKVHGLIYLNESTQEKDTFSIATSIVHETAHQALFIETAIDRLIPNDFAKPIFSPIRNEYRPAIGALHGLFAMSRMLIWSNHVKNLNKKHSARADKLKNSLVPKIKDAIDTLRVLELSDRGNALIRDSQSTLDMFGSSF